MPTKTSKPAARKAKAAPAKTASTSRKAAPKKAAASSKPAAKKAASSRKAAPAKRATPAKKSTSRRPSSKRELIDTGTDKRFVRRGAAGKFKESDDVGRSLAQDVRKHAKTVAPSGQGDRGDHAAASGKKKSKK